MSRAVILASDLPDNLKLCGGFEVFGLSKAFQSGFHLTKKLKTMATHGPRFPVAMMTALLCAEFGAKVHMQS